MSVKPFFDTNILIYAFSREDPRSDVARILLALGGIISVQVLNELTAVLRRKLKLGWKDVTEALHAVRVLCPKVASVTCETHEKALEIAEKFGYQIYDSLIIAAADEAKCKTLYSEDMNDGQMIGGVTIRNPFQNTKQE
jgi:predicted nucleic acid-binding protein